MSVLKIDERGAYERDVEQNWAAAYAKRLVNELERKHDEDKSVIDASLEAISAEVDERATRTQLDDAVDFIESELAYKASAEAVADGSALGDKSIYSRHIREGNITTGKIHDLNVTEAKLAADSVTTEKIKDKNVTRAKLANDAKIDETITISGDLQFRYGDGEHISYGSLGDKVISVFGLPIRDAAAQEWIANNCILDTIDPPDSFDEGFVPHTGLLYLQSDGLAVMKIFVYSGVTSLGTNIWRQIYPSFTTYSTAPQRVGTWIDNKPVWRVALPYIPMEHGVRHLHFDTSRGDIFFMINMLMEDYIDPSYDNDYVTIINMNIYPVNDVFSGLCGVSFANGIVYFCKSQPDSDLFSQGWWGGYIDFVCPEEYIKYDEE